jgi:hypothetical protein
MDGWMIDWIDYNEDGLIRYKIENESHAILD